MIYVFGWNYVEFPFEAQADAVRVRRVLVGQILAKTGCHRDSSLLVIERTGVYLEDESHNMLVIPPFISDVFDTWAWEAAPDPELENLRRYLDRIMYKVHCEASIGMREHLENEPYEGV